MSAVLVADVCETRALSIFSFLVDCVPQALPVFFALGAGLVDLAETPVRGQETRAQPVFWVVVAWALAEPVAPDDQGLTTH